jgi:hypothetical protein
MFILRLGSLPASPLAHQPETFIVDLIRHLIMSKISFQEDNDPSIACIDYFWNTAKSSLRINWFKPWA